MKRLMFMLAVIVCCRPVFAEMRVWKDLRGKEYKAEFVRELFDKVTLRDAAGNEHRLTVEDLSEHDQKYLRVMIPPEMEIRFSLATDIKPKPPELYDLDNDVITIIKPEVQITKKSKRPFTSRLRAELFLIAKEVDGPNYILLAKTESSFLLNEQNNNTHEFKAGPVEVQVYTEYNNFQRRGAEYLGYLVAVSDMQGTVFQVKTDVDWLADKTGQLRELYARGAASVYSRHFDRQTVQKTKVPRPTYYTQRHR